MDNKIKYKYIKGNCFTELNKLLPNSITAIITDPPYGVREYTPIEIEKMKNKKGGIWRIPQNFDGCKRQPVPRFSVINDDPRERENVYMFFYEWAKLIYNVIVPGGHIFIATTPLLSDILSLGLRKAGFERRGEIMRTVSTLRGGDRPKGAEIEFSDTSVIPRGLYEPWGLYRKPISERTVAENIRKWKAGALRRLQKDVPFGDFIISGKTPQCERKIANHPSLKPQKFLRKLVYAALPVGEGIILDPFAGSGSTLAAAESFGYSSLGFESNDDFFNIGINAIPKLAGLYREQIELPLKITREANMEE